VAGDASLERPDDRSAARRRASVEISRGPNIAPLPVFPPLDDDIEADVLLALGDDITTDHLMPAGAKILPLRSNIPEISKHCFELVDSTFPARARESGAGSSSPEATTGRGRAASTPRSRRAISASGPSSRNPSRGSTGRT
jgi:hypothetical protein